KLPWNLFKIFEVGSSSRCSRPCCFRKNSEVKSCCSTSMIKRWYCSMVSCTLEILEEKSMILLKYLPTIRFPKTYQITTRDQGIPTMNAAENNIREIPAKQGAQYRIHRGTNGRCSPRQWVTLSWECSGRVAPAMAQNRGRHWERSANSRMACC